MILEQYYLGCLSHASYLIGDESTGRAVVVDPQRDVNQYIADAERRDLSIERVIETHFHADFLSGHLELAEATGAAISYGAPAAGATEYAIDPLEHGRVLSLGKVQLEVRATPGHTPESISIVVYEREGATPHAVLTGDALFIGDVGRPDLLSAEGTSTEAMARRLYRSLHEQLMTLPDATLVYPAHGAGSACGKHLSNETVSTIGEQRRTNYALQPMTEHEFVEIVTDGQATAPLYFAFALHRNRQAHPSLDEDDATPELDFEATRLAQHQGAIVIDTRDANEFAGGHLRRSINVGLGGRFAESAGDVVPAGTPIVLVTAPGHEQEARIRLSRIGFDSVLGAVKTPLTSMAAHPEVVDRASRLTASQLDELRHGGDLQIVDVRGDGELEAGVVPDSIHISLAELTRRLADLDRERPTVVYCASGYRSSIAASALRHHGFTDVSDLIGGYGAWALHDQ